MFWLLAGLAIVTAGIAVLLAPDGAESAEEGSGTVGTAIPDGPITADELRRLDLPMRGRGYDPATVDVLLERLAAQAPTAAQPPSGEELEDGGGDLPGRLDR